MNNICFPFSSQYFHGTKEGKHRALRAYTHVRDGHTQEAGDRQYCVRSRICHRAIDRADQMVQDMSREALDTSMPFTVKLGKGLLPDDLDSYMRTSRFFYVCIIAYIQFTY